MATASKAFRARAFDSNRSMTVYWAHELPDLAECSVGNRAVTQMPSGMEKEEEMESHLQDAILAQQASTSGVQVNHVIPTPKVSQVDENRYNSTYHSRNKMQRSKYIKVHAWQALERDDPEYDYDSEDEAWLADHTHVEPRILEKIFDTVESHSSETQIASEDSVINIHKSLDSSVVYEVYEYWLSKRTSAATTSGCVGVGGLIPRVRNECRKDGQGAVNPYVAFRRRAEKMQTRKNRKNDEDSYEKILKLVHDMSKARQLFDMTARREKQKVALIDMESEILARRMEMADFGARNAFQELNEKLRASSEISSSGSSKQPFAEINGTSGSAQEEKKRKRNRRKPNERDLVSKAWLKKNAESWNRPPALFGAQNGAQVQVTTKPVRESMQDGKFAFKRRRGCVYRAALSVYPAPMAPASAPQPTASTSQNCAQNCAQNAPIIPANHRFFETFLPDASGTIRSIGMARRRMGRGGRVLFDRMPRNPEEQRASTDPWAEYCVADSSRTFRARQSSLCTEEESEEQSPKSRYFARSDRVTFNDTETEREWAASYQESMWNEKKEEPSEKFDDLEALKAKKRSSCEQKEDDSEVERMDVDEQDDDDAQLTEMNGKKKEEVEDMDVDEEEIMSNGAPPKKNGKVVMMKPLQEHSPPPLSGNGRADRAEPTPVPAKMCGTVSDSDEWREPSGSPSESNSSTEWGGGGYAAAPIEENHLHRHNHQNHRVATALKAKLMNVDDEMDDEMEVPSPARGSAGAGGGAGARDLSIKDSMSTVTMLEKNYMMPSTIGM